LRTIARLQGPFETIDLNAPGGIKDYCNRYLGGVYGVLKEEDNSRVFTQHTIEQLTDSMRSRYAVEKVPEVSAWRDERLLALKNHKRECEATIDARLKEKL
jgi:hypothetical protein